MLRPTVRAQPLLGRFGFGVDGIGDVITNSFTAWVRLLQAT